MNRRTAIDEYLTAAFALAHHVRMHGPISERPALKANVAAAAVALDATAEESLEPEAN